MDTVKRGGVAGMALIMALFGSVILTDSASAEETSSSATSGYDAVYPEEPKKESEYNNSYPEKPKEEVPAPEEEICPVPEVPEESGQGGNDEDDDDNDDDKDRKKKKKRVFPAVGISTGFGFSAACFVGAVYFAFRRRE